mgnify:CR=1 FL=1
MSSERYIVSVKRDAETQEPTFEFLADARIDKGYMHLFTEGSPTLEATWKLTAKSGAVSEYKCFMPDSYQNFEVIDVPDVEVKAGDKFAFSVNDPECVCHFVLDCWASASLWPAPEPEVPSEPQEDMRPQEV